MLSLRPDDGGGGGVPSNWSTETGSLGSDSTTLAHARRMAASVGSLAWCTMMPPGAKCYVQSRACQKVERLFNNIYGSELFFSSSNQWCALGRNDLRHHPTWMASKLADHRFKYTQACSHKQKRTKNTKFSSRSTGQSSWILSSRRRRNFEYVCNRPTANKQQPGIITQPAGGKRRCIDCALVTERTISINRTEGISALVFFEKWC